MPAILMGNSYFPMGQVDLANSHQNDCRQFNFVAQVERWSESVAQYEVGMFWRALNYGSPDNGPRLEECLKKAINSISCWKDDRVYSNTGFARYIKF